MNSLKRQFDCNWLVYFVVSLVTVKLLLTVPFGQLATGHTVGGRGDMLVDAIAAPI